MLRSHHLRLCSVTGGIYIQGVQKHIKNKNNEKPIQTNKNIKDIKYAEYIGSTRYYSDTSDQPTKTTPSRPVQRNARTWDDDPLNILDHHAYTLPPLTTPRYSALKTLCFLYTLYILCFYSFFIVLYFMFFCTLCIYIPPVTLYNRRWWDLNI
jgi:hypothetical protein